MFNDELPFTCKKMQEFSIVDGFVEITESSAEMVTSLANEPSVGLFYVQQHTQNAVPSLINIKDNVESKSHELTFHTEDMEDSITMVKSMKMRGFPIVDDMLIDIKRSISIMSSKQPKRGLINSSSSGFQMGNFSSWTPINTREDSELSGNYFSSVFKSAKERASSFKWLDLNDELQPKDEKVDSQLDSVEVEFQDKEEDRPGDDLPNQQLLPVNFDEFRADREAKLEEWLGENV